MLQSDKCAILTFFSQLRYQLAIDITITFFFCGGNKPP